MPSENLEILEWELESPTTSNLTTWNVRDKVHEIVQENDNSWNNSGESKNDELETTGLYEIVKFEWQKAIDKIDTILNGGQSLAISLYSSSWVEESRLSVLQNIWGLRTWEKVTYSIENNIIHIRFEANSRSWTKRLFAELTWSASTRDWSFSIATEE